MFLTKNSLTTSLKFVCVSYVPNSRCFQTYVNDKFADKEWLKKLTKHRLGAFNILRAKVRKGIEEYRGKVDEFRQNPEAFEEESVFTSSEAESSSSTTESVSEAESSESDAEKVGEKNR